MTTTTLLLGAAVLAALIAGTLLVMRLSRRRRVPVPADDPRTGDVQWESLRYVERIWELPAAGEDAQS